jgi:hypothetical protein
MVYLVKKNGAVLSFYSEKAMKENGFEIAEQEVDDEVYAANGGYARIINNQIVIGKTAEEVKEEQIKVLKDHLADVDHRAGCGRAVRAIALAVASETGITILDVQKLQELENEAVILRDSLETVMET